MISSNSLFVFSSISLRKYFYFLFKGFKHSPKVIFQVIFFCFICIWLFKSYCFRVTVFVGVMLFFVVLSVFLSCLPIFSSDWCSLGCVSGDHSSQCHWIQGSNGCFLWQFFQSPWRSLGTSRSHLVLLEVSLQPQKLFSPASMEITYLGLFP